MERRAALVQSKTRMVRGGGGAPRVRRSKIRPETSQERDPTERVTLAVGVKYCMPFHPSPKLDLAATPSALSNHWRVAY